MHAINNTFSSFQKLGKSLMLPIAVLPIAALLLRFGVLLKLDFITAAGSAVFDNLALIFGIGVAIGLAVDGNGAAGLAGAVAHFIIVKGSQAINSDINMGVLSGIIGGIVAAWCYNKFYNITLPSWLGFFAGRRFVPIITGLICVGISFIFGYLWIYIQDALSSTTAGLASLGAIGLFIYGTLNRLLIPLGLHHILNTYFWFQFGEYEGSDGVVNGDLTRFFAGDTTAGNYMTGFFPIMMFALPAAAFAMYVLAKKDRKSAAAGILFSVAFTSFLTGITEPLEFAFMFLAPVLYLFHSLFTGLALAITHALGIKLGFGFSAGLIDYIVNWNLATKPALMIPIGLLFALLYFVVFIFAIKTFNLKTIGREDEVQASPQVRISVTEEARAFAEALGGLANILSISSCVTRLRADVVDGAKVDKDRMKELGSSGIITPSSNAVQIVLGQKAEPLADAINVLKKA